MRGERQVFARGLALTLAKKLALQGDEVWVRFFDSRLYDVVKMSRSGSISVPYLLCFRSERGRNYGKVFRQLLLELTRLRQDQRRLLVRHRQAELPGLRRGVPAQSSSPDVDGAAIGVDEPTGDPEEGRLPRAVLADHGVDLTGSAVEADVGQRSDRPELPGDAAQLEDEVLIRRPSCGIAVAHELANICVRTSSGTSEVPETDACGRFSSQSASVTCRIT